MNELTFNTLYLSSGNAEKDAVCLGSFRRHHPDASILIREFKKERFLDDIQEAAITVGDDLVPRFTNLVILDDSTFITRPIRIEPRYEVAGSVRFCGEKSIWWHDKFNNNGQKIHIGRAGMYISAHVVTTFSKAEINEKWIGLLKEYTEEFHADLLFSLICGELGFSCGHWLECSSFDNDLGFDLYNRYVPIKFNSDKTILTNHFII